MARFRCRSCSSEGTMTYDCNHACPRCGSHDVQIALSVEDLSDDDPLTAMMRRLAAGDLD